ncbi:ribosome maturation factor RimP [Lutibacter sp. B2]|nr:ribosome maturation factor RimP [Lutibacter sp. B2]
MAKERIADIVEKIVMPKIEEQKFELVDVEFLKEGQDWYLRVYVDKEGGITLDDCKIVSDFLSEKLDELEPIQQQYYLEVSSPGLDRTLKTERDFEKYRGRQIEIYLYKAIEGNKMLEGELIGLKEGCVAIKSMKNEEVEIHREQISKVKLAVKF